MNELPHYVLSNLNDLTEYNWLPKLTPLLVEKKWASLEVIGVLPENYNSNNLLASSKGPFFLIQERVTGIPIYGISKQLLRADIRARSYTLKELKCGEILDCLAEAFEFISKVPSLISTLRLLISNIHLIKPEDDGYDVSYSLPDVPFSIFISVPSIRIKHDVLRVAEAILHEAMHLQLTLIDEISPLINSNSDISFFSPWKNEFRHPLGLLHALYVFKNIRDFLDLSEVADNGYTYRLRRIRDIDSQISSTKNFEKYEGLTLSGKALTKRLYGN